MTGTPAYMAVTIVMMTRMIRMIVDDIRLFNEYCPT